MSTEQLLGLPKEMLAERLHRAMKSLAEANAAVRPYMDAVESYRERVQSLQAIAEMAGEMVWSYERRHDIGEDEAEVTAMELTSLIKEAVEKGHLSRWVAERCGE